MEVFNTTMLIINAIGTFGAIFYFIIKYKYKLDKALEGYQKIASIEKYIEDLSDFFHVKNHDSVPGQLKDYSRYYQSNSPVKLTHEGHELVVQSGFKRALEEKKDFVFEHLRQKLDSKTDDTFFYFSEKYSQDLILEFYDNEDKILDSFRRYLFTQGLMGRKEEVLKVLGLYLRDQIIQDYGKQKDFQKLFN